MPTKNNIPLLQIIREAVFPFGDDRVSDRELLGSFAEKRDESAFAALVRRHGAMVLGVALRVLRNHQDAEDVCQATFLLLAKKANSMLWRDSVVNWLYGVAYRIALKSCGERQRRAVREKKLAAKAQPDTMIEIGLRDLQTILDNELARLPKKYSELLLLCCLEGRTRDEAARSLGLPVATVKSRLEEGREMLRRRLVRRGVELTTVLASVTLLSTSVSASLVRATSRAALKVLMGESIAGSVSVGAFALTKKGFKTMLFAKLKVATTVLLAFGIAATGIVAVSQNEKGLAQNTPKKSPILEANNKASPDTEQLSVAIAKRADDSLNAIVFSGRVVAPDGGAVAGANLYLVPDLRSAPGTWNEVLEDKSQPSKSPVYATTDVNGEFQFNVPKSKIGEWPSDLAASAPRFGAGWVTIAKGGATSKLTIPLVTDHVPITGRASCN